MKPISYLHLLLATVLALTGCAPVNSTAIPMRTEPQNPSPSPVLPISTSTFPPAETVTPVLLATLESEQTKNTIKSFLQEPVVCLPPCFFGVMPGQTTLDEAKKTFIHLGIQLKKTNTRKNKDFYQATVDFDSGLSVSPLLTVQNDNVKNLRVYIIPEKYQTGIPREWLAFSPEILINRYGPPSKVDVSIDWGPSPSYAMIIYFEAVDLIIEYYSYNIGGDSVSPQVCPLTDQFDSVRVWMGKDPENPPLEGIPLEEATSMSLEEFSKLMTGNSDNACFNIKGEMFP